MKQYFITGIDTDCGKTFITGHLAKQLTEARVKTITTKLIQTGCSGISEDIEEHRRIMGCDIKPEDKDFRTCPTVCSFPASPHLALALDNRTFDTQKTQKEFENLGTDYEFVLTEGAGGLLVPITQNYLTADFITQYNLPTILVSSSRLGSINHTLLSLEYCKQKAIDLRMLVFNQFPSDDKTIAKSTFQFLKEKIEKDFPDCTVVHSKEIFAGKGEVLDVLR